MRTRIILAAVVTALLVFAPLAWAQDPDTGGVPQVDADAACAAVVDEDPPAAEAEAAFRAAYNTVDNTDDGPASEGVSADWQALIYQQELHRDYLGMGGWAEADPAEVPTFSCEVEVAVFPPPAAPVPEPEPTETPTPTTEPEPTETPTSTPTTPAEPPFVDLDCVDLGDAAQAKLDETPGADPHRLDSDGDRIACELEEVDLGDEPDGDFDQVVTVPRGGVDTGDGSTL